MALISPVLSQIDSERLCLVLGPCSKVMVRKCVTLYAFVGVYAYRVLVGSGCPRFAVATMAADDFGTSLLVGSIALAHNGSLAMACQG